ncbi:MAG: prepilin-type N-terminal cleavage/methylation domain-containing protein [Thermoanaerobacteraceae bacterium]|nr:prepilin-type N-terminal cleavage/methylation domain-containing protein [Thermoanaerobacteraceae bacterium]
MKLNNKGLTLIELITVLSIFSLFILISFPSTNFFKSSTSQFRLKILAYEVINDIRYIQQKSIFENESLNIELFEDHTGYFINKPGNLMNTRIKIKKLPKGMYIYKLIDKDNPFKDSINKKTIYFSNLGAPNGGCTIVLQNDLNRQINITILPATGRTMIKGDY